MKVRTRLAAGYAVLVLLLVGVLAYHVSLLDRAVSTNRTLAEISRRLTVSSALQTTRIERLGEYAQKFMVTRDTGYAARLDEAKSAFAGGLREMAAGSPTFRERAELDSLGAEWSRVSGLLPRPTELRVGGSGATGDTVGQLAALRDGLDRLRERSQRFSEASQAAMASQVRRSVDAADAAARWSWIAVGVALLIAVVVSWRLVRSISTGLRRLASGTRQVSRGDFDVWIPERGDDEFGQLAGAFNEMTRKLGELEEMKRDFVSHVSHELRTPLASIQETLQLMLEEIPGPLGEEQRHLLQLNLRSARRLSGMISRLLDLSRFEAGAVHYEFRRVDLVELATLVSEELGGTGDAGDRVVTRLPAGPLPAVCDGDRIQQVIQNYLDNALKYAPPETEIELAVSRVEEVPDSLDRPAARRLSTGGDGPPYLHVAVSDRGPGVPPEEREAIFGKFHQIRRPGRPGPGVGLGLALVRQIAQAHRGVAWVSEREGGGAIFHFLFPVDRADGIGPARGGSEKGAASGRPAGGRADGAGRAAGAAGLALLLLLVGGCASSESGFERAWREGRYREAAAAFEADSSLARNETSLYQAAMLYALPSSPLFDPERALGLYRSWLQRFPESSSRADVRLMVQLLERDRELRRSLRDTQERADRRTAERDSLAARAAALDSMLTEQKQQTARLRGELQRVRQELERLKQIDLQRRP